jgi:hypothetical protein
LKSDSKSAKIPQLQISNSSAIRYTVIAIDPSIEVFAIEEPAVLTEVLPLLLVRLYQ